MPRVEAEIRIPVKTVKTTAVCRGRRLKRRSFALPTLLPKLSPNAAMIPPSTNMAATKIYALVIKAISGKLLAKGYRIMNGDFLFDNRNHITFP